MYNIGDKIQIKSWKNLCQYAEEKGGIVTEESNIIMYAMTMMYCNFTFEMKIFESRKARIVKKIIRNNITSYILDIDNGDWDWQDWMFDNPLEIMLKRFYEN